MEIDLNKLYDDNLKEFNEIEKIIKEEGVSIFGAGIQGQYAIKHLKDYNYKVNYFIDNDRNKCGKKINEIEIIHNGSNLSSQQKVVLISIFYNYDIIEQNKDKYKYLIPFNKFFFMKEFRNFIKIRNSFYDNTSKNIYDILLFSKFISNTMYIIPSIYSRNHYFSIDECFPNSNEIFLDAGAYVGDTVEKFIENCEGVFNKIYAFEPGDVQYNSMNIRIKRLIEEWALDENSIILEKLGLSEENKIVFFNDENKLERNSISENGNKKIKVVCIDEYLNGKPITFLKSDIEGEEINMLKGASETIKKYKPKMAISIYHRPDDFFTIPEYIKSLVPEYKFYLRHHSIEFGETVLYCCV
ncbi:hypothetical protein SU46_11595 [Brachyspira hyodysenteriae]|uniref:FkbM family methyltransferase n=1 Tax=Brachyspira hyodysenteriae TaxID=159 RepID=UPI00063DDAA8|nr:FkbM family methyltransferase [Brachyspira hyodysenteriae]KLI14117.1 hypothetical protein SU46_11595 [Brachyspira hyodysenteriae]KLI38857.1 hypothetical protein SZ51_06030 [Brachyspira hyodysenteriae]